MADNTSNKINKTSLQKKICVNCKREFIEGADFCQFCEEFGENNKEKLLKIKDFSNDHFSRGYFKGFASSMDFDDA
jgi:rRNA maturation endonuclease Nob1